MFNLFKKKKVEEPVKEESQIEYFRHKKNPWEAPEFNREEVIMNIFQRDFSRLMPKKNGKAVAMDSAVCHCNFKGEDIPEDILKFYGSHFFIGWQACALLRQNPYIDKACTIPAQDAISPDYKISYVENTDAENQDNDDEKLAEMKQISDNDYNIKEVCYRANVDKKTFGISLVVPVIDGVDYKKPYNIEAVKKGSYKGMTVVEPYWTAPQLDGNAVSNPMNIGFQEPTWWRMPNGTLVHKSWCIKRCNSELPDILKPTYYYGGVPLTQKIYERVYAAEKVANEAPLLALTKRMLIVDANIENLVANECEAQEKIRMAQYYRDNFSMWFKNPDDDVKQIDTSLTDFDSLVMTQYQLVASIADMPATKLLKTQPKGFNATGEYEQKDYIQSLQSIQEQDYIPILKMHYELFTKSFYGKTVELAIVFNPVDMPSEKETAEVAKIWSDVDSNYISAGVMSAEEVRDVRRSQDDSPYSALADEMEGAPDEELNQAADEAINEEIQWITVNGNHVPLLEGKSKSESIKDFFEDKKEYDVIKDGDANFGKAGKYELYRAGNLTAPNGMIFLTPSMKEATFYADEDTNNKFDKYIVDIKNPLIIEASGDIEAAKKAYKALHGVEFKANELTSKAWQRLDKANASKLKKSDYDSIMYKIDGEFTEVQIVKERGKDISHKKTYSKIDISKTGNKRYEKAYKEYMDYNKLDENYQHPASWNYEKSEELRKNYKKESSKAYIEEYNKIYGEDEALDWKGDFDESKVSREHGRFAKADNTKIEPEVKTPRYVERKPQGSQHSEWEDITKDNVDSYEQDIINNYLYGKIKGKESAIGKEFPCNSYDYEYIVRVDDLYDLIPVKRRRIP